MSLLVAVITNSVSSWAILPVVALASTPKTETVILGGLFYVSFVSVTSRLVVCGLLFVVRACLTDVINFVLNFLPHGQWFDFVFFLRLVGLCEQRPRE